MKNVRRLVPVLAGLLGTSGAWGAALAACSSSSSSSQDAGSSDATTDGESDGQSEAQADTGVGTDAVADSSTGQPDTSTTTDTGSPVDTGAPDGDAGLPDTYVYDASAALAFPGQVAAALCTAAASCCGTSGDASTFNWSLCYNGELGGGFGGSNAGANLFSAGNITFNPAAAEACLTAIGQIDCTTNQVPSAEEVQLFQSCYAAYSGTLPAGSSCQGSIECAPGNFCLQSDGGTGVCQALVGDGGACGAIGQAMCSYRGSGDNGLYCKYFAEGSPTVHLDAGLWTCAPQASLSAECDINVGCSSFECPSSSNTCASSTFFIGASTCNAFKILDAGSD